MALAEHAEELLDGLPRDWEVARVDVTLEDAEAVQRAALLLAPASPGRAGSTFHVEVRRGADAAGATPHSLLRVLDRLESEGIAARLRLVSHTEREPRPPRAPAAVAAADRRLTEQWDRLVAKLPPDWSDALAEVVLDSTDHVDLAALKLGPVNPFLVDGDRTFQFRVAHTFGYGAAPGMTRRCLERLDETGITGRFRILRVLSDTRPVHTQGPVWRIGGRAV